jgi:hypothetical protein
MVSPWFLALHSNCEASPNAYMSQSLGISLLLELFADEE